MLAEYNAPRDRRLTRETSNWEVRLDKQTGRYFHGCNWVQAEEIRRTGAIPPSGGCLGRGIYFAREDMARRFAEEASRHRGGGGGGVVQIIVTFSNPKHVQAQDTNWSQEAYDACRSDLKCGAMNMEWCVRNPSQVRVVDVERFDGKRWLTNAVDADLMDRRKPTDAMLCPNCRSAKVIRALETYGDGDMAKGQQKLPGEQWGCLLCQACNYLFEPADECGYSFSPAPCRPKPTGVPVSTEW